MAIFNSRFQHSHFLTKLAYISLYITGTAVIPLSIYLSIFTVLGPSFLVYLSSMLLLPLLGLVCINFALEKMLTPTFKSKLYRNIDIALGVTSLFVILPIVLFTIHSHFAFSFPLIHMLIINFMASTAISDVEQQRNQNARSAESIPSMRAQRREYPSQQLSERNTASRNARLHSKPMADPKAQKMTDGAEGTLPDESLKEILCPLSNPAPQLDREKQIAHNLEFFTAHSVKNPSNGR